MVDPLFKRIAGIHEQEDGVIGAVWLAYNKDRDLIHVYDACLFKQEVLAVIAEGINCRGRWIPIAWNDKAKDLSDKLLMDRGCNMLKDGCNTAERYVEVTARDVWERMRTARFKVDPRLKEWTDEFEAYYKDGVKLPKESSPLMSATLNAVDQLPYARRQATRTHKNMAPKLAIV